MLYLVPTPIGNKEDITLRALRLLKEIDFIITENINTTKNLFRMYDLDYSNKKFSILNSYTTEYHLNSYIDQLKSVDGIIMSEAGTPGFLDPGKIFIKKCRENNIEFQVLPGANALIPAIVSVNFPTNHFYFGGFLPQKKGRSTDIKKYILMSNDTPVFFYESVHRIEKLLEELKKFEFVGDVFVIREISKMFEQKYSGPVDDLLDLIKTGKFIIKGEFIVGIYKKAHI